MNRKTENAESSARETRADKGGKAFSQDDPRREGGVRKFGRGDGDIRGRAAGESGEKKANGDPITGGIISQLIEQVEDQLGNARACIDWYQKEEAKHETRLEELHKLKALLEKTTTDD